MIDLGKKKRKATKKRRARRSNAYADTNKLLTGATKTVAGVAVFGITANALTSISTS